MVRLAAPTSDAAGRGPGGVWERRSRPRTRKMETSTPAKAIAAPAQKALTNPSVRAALRRFRARARPLWLSGIPGHNAARALLDGGHRDVWGA